MINLFYITNNVIEAQIVDDLDIDWIFIDLETIGKKDRQNGRDTVLSNHNIDDIQKIKSRVNNTKILVRCNPIGKWSKDEFDEINLRGSKIDMVMLPYFKTIDEVKTFIELLDTSKMEAALLIETMDAISNLEKIIKIFPFKYMHIGLNDLHIERGTFFMFEPFIDGLITKITSICKENNQNFGIGGIGKIGTNLSPSPECVLNEHLRLNSNGVILSRSFKGNFNEKEKVLFRKRLSKSVEDLRNYEKLAKTLDSKQLLESYKLMKTDIEKTIKNGKIQ
tara:strand:+ start:587 stop:1423 length:837 start_codon:yes stop_codon:yes gene_type:complete